MFLAPDFFGGRTPEFLDLYYKIQRVSDHVAKFRGIRPRDFGERVAKEKRKKNITSILYDLPYIKIVISATRHESTVNGWDKVITDEERVLKESWIEINSLR